MTETTIGFLGTGTLDQRKASKLIDTYLTDHAVSDVRFLFVPEELESHALGALVTLAQQRSIPFEVMTMADDERVSDGLIEIPIETECVHRVYDPISLMLDRVREARLGSALFMLWDMKREGEMQEVAGGFLLAGVSVFELTDNLTPLGLVEENVITDEAGQLAMIKASDATADDFESSAAIRDESLSDQDNATVGNIKTGFARFARYKGYTRVLDMGDLPQSVAKKFALLGSVKDGSRINSKLLTEIDVEITAYQQRQSHMTVNPEIVDLLCRMDLSTGLEPDPTTWRLETGEPLTDRQIDLIQYATPDDFEEAARTMELKLQADVVEAALEMRRGRVAVELIRSVKGATCLADLTDRDIDHFVAKHPEKKDDVELLLSRRHKYMKDDLMADDDDELAEWRKAGLLDPTPVLGLPYSWIALNNQAEARVHDGMTFDQWLDFLDRKIDEPMSEKTLDELMLVWAGHAKWRMDMEEQGFQYDGSHFDPATGEGGFFMRRGDKRVWSGDRNRTDEP